MDDNAKSIGPGELVRLFADFYEKNMFRPDLRELHDWMLNVSLRAAGYNNFQNAALTGEDFFLSNILAPSEPSLCLDVGANVGGYSRMILEKTGADVVSFEPLNQVFEDLKRALAPYGDRATAVNMGVGDEEKTLSIRYNSASLSHASFSEEANKVAYVQNDMMQDVTVTTLDRYCSDNAISKIDLLKIDVEGFETEVLSGARRVLRDIRPRFIQIEFNWHQLFRGQSLYGFSELLPGYDVYQLLPYCWARRDPRRPETNIYHFSNFVFVRQ